MEESLRRSKFYRENAQMVQAGMLIGLAIYVAFFACHEYYRQPQLPTLVSLWAVGLATIYSIPIVMRLRRFSSSYEGEYRPALEVLSSESGISKCRILVAQNDMMGAAACGFWGQATVILTSSLCQLPYEQLEAVFAHELGHLAHRDALVKSAIGLTLLDLMCWLSVSLTNYLQGNEATLFVISSCMAVATLVPVLAYNRAIERRTDRFAACLTGKPENLAKALSSMLENNYLLPGIVVREKEPFWVRMFNTHPAIHERIRMYGQA